MICKSSAYVALTEVDRVFAHLLANAKEHDVVLNQSGPKDFKILVGESFISIGSGDAGLTLSICAESVGILYFLKEATVRQLAEISPEAAEVLRWQDAGKRSVNLKLPPSFHELSVISVSKPMDGLIRLRLSGARDMTGLGGPGFHVKLMLPVNRERAAVWPEMSDNGATKWPDGDDALHVRYYTIKSTDPVTGAIDIDIVRHQGGVIADWAETAETGAKIGLLGPGGGEKPSSVDRVLLCGDKTALPALARMLEELPDTVVGDVVAEAENLDSLKAYLPPVRLAVHALPKAKFRQEIRRYSEGLSVKTKPDFAWFAGEHQNAQTMRKFFKADLGLSKGRQYAITYWRDGASLEAN